MDPWKWLKVLYYECQTSSWRCYFVRETLQEHVIHMHTMSLFSQICVFVVCMEILMAYFSKTFQSLSIQAPKMQLSFKWMAKMFSVFSWKQCCVNIQNEQVFLNKSVDASTKIITCWHLSNNVNDRNSYWKIPTTNTHVDSLSGNMQTNTSGVIQTVGNIRTLVLLFVNKKCIF